MRRLGRRDDTGSMPVAMLLTIVGSGLSAVLLSTVLQQAQLTRTDVGRTHALQAARAGMESALGNIRAAKDADGRGVVGQLPGCQSGGPPVSGWADDGTLSYEVSILYLTEDPSKRDVVWTTNNGKSCASDLGDLPLFAYITSVGTETISGHQRTLFGTYSFRTAMQGNVPGGHLRIYKTATAVHSLCVDAGPNPNVGAAVTMQECKTRADDKAIEQQSFGYQPNLTIRWAEDDVKNKAKKFPNGLCLDAGSPHAANSVVRLQTCMKTNVSQQQWSFNTASGFIGSRDGRTLDDTCFTVDQPDTPGSALVLNDAAGGHSNGNPACNTNFPNNVQSWDPTPDFGAGAAGEPATRQLVNYQQFGRCLDVMNMNPDNPYELIFPCKQNPDLAVRDWNQQWYLPDSGTGLIYSETPLGRYCLTAPLLGSDPAFVDAMPCSAPIDAQRRTWVVRGSSAPSRDEEYRIEGSGTYKGYCLAPVPETGWLQADAAGIVACSGADDQKWNAPPPSTPAALTNIGER